MLRFLCASAALMLTVGCVHSPSPSPPWVNLMQVESKRWGDYAGMTVLVYGTAQNCKRSAAVVLADLTPVYLDDLDYWPEDLTKKEVMVTGILIYHPKREPPEKGGAYIEGPYYSLASATWAKVK